MDLKYDILKHPNVAFTTDGKGKPYEHGQDHVSIAEAELSQDEELLDNAMELTEGDEDIVILTEDELEEHIEEYGGINFEKL